MTSRRQPVIALAGQPNCGKSTIFNAAAGFQVNTGNFAGTTVSFFETQATLSGHAFSLVDLPGTYSISSVDAAEKVTRDFLLSGRVDVVINVIDASMLSRSLELTLQLMEMGVPMVVAVNMMDEAERKGISLDLQAFQRLTGLTAIPVIAVRGKGIQDVFLAALALACSRNYHPIAPVYDRDVEDCISEIIRDYPEALRKQFQMHPRFVAMRLLEMDEEFERTARDATPDFTEAIIKKRQDLARLHDWPEAEVFSSHRHAVVLNLYEKVADHSRPAKKSVGEWIDRFVMNPFGGIATILSSVLLLFVTAFLLGNFLSDLINPAFDFLRHAIASNTPGIFSGLLAHVLGGVVDGLQAGAGIVVPYLLPLLFLLGIYEDTGLLPRIAFLVDGILHRFGLHGRAAMPLAMGYGCTVPALMASNSLDTPRDRFIARILIPFVPCSARTVIIIGLAGKYLGPFWAAGIYLGNIAVTLGISYFLSRSLAPASTGTIMEVPPLRRPYLSIALKKVWLRFYEFLLLGWPVVLAASIALSLLSAFGWDRPINTALSPLTLFLRLPVAVGITLFLGIFRKELAILMLAAALGTTDLGAALSRSEMLVFTLFTVFYVPCIASLTTIWKEGGWKNAALSAGLSLGLALVIAGSAAWLSLLFS